MFCENVNIATTTQATHCVPNILIQSAACLFFKSFGYFNKAAFYALSVGDSFSCVHDGTLWQTFETAMMQPLHLDKSLHCYPVKASCPRHAIVHKDHILHDCEHAQIPSAVLSHREKMAAFFPGKQPNIWFLISHTCT